MDTTSQHSLLLSTKIPNIRYEQFHNYFRGFHVSLVTPAFNINRIDKQQLLHDFRNNMNKEEKRLVFLACLASTGLLSCKVPPFPNDAIVDALFPRLLLITQWITNIHLPNYNLPTYQVTHETANLSNLKYWVEALFELKDAFYQERRQVEAVAALKKQEETLELLIRRAEMQHTAYTPATSKMLATWALEISKAPTNMHTTWLAGNKEYSGTIKDYWYYIMTAPTSSIYNIKNADIEELIEHLEDNLEHGTTSAYTVLKYVRSLRDKQTKGLGMFEMLGLSQEAVDTTMKVAAVASGHIPTTQSLPPAPIKANFPKLTDYLLAKITWERECKQVLEGTGTGEAGTSHKFPSSHEHNLQTNNSSNSSRGDNHEQE